ncbi:DNA repair protein RecN [Lacisediminimonas sp.]|uniref:DNA repair protein RecN n=1 Tax=Lacisediminimonas sp. TaxID=3060582 RepID=UPI00271DB13A|nr:DNA repair protein RecN [Lacisediminimonas sp.]MDO8300331.1 DNA repair protein RecN [Lacisediminimonas sp.]
MLRSLSIRDFVIVDAIDIELASGFTVFTGETGAGKSILVDALALVLGGRGDASVIREGAARADISAEFRAPQGALPWLQEHAFDVDGDGILLRRVIDSAGRSKSFINGVPATATQLRELGEMLVDIHGQHAHQSLLRTNEQRLLLDQQAGLEPQTRAVAAAFKAWRAVARQREEFESNARDVLLERERLAWQVGELEKLAQRPGEWTEVTLEQSRLANAAALIEGTQEALQEISESETGAMLSRLSTLEHKMAKLAEIDSSLKPVMEALEPARIQLQEAAYALKDYLDRVELDPARLREVDARVEAIHGMARKFRLAPEELPQEFERLSAQLQQLADATDMESLRAQEDQLALEFRRLAGALSAARARAALALSGAVTEAMQELSMAGGCLEIALHPCEPASHGLEQVEFLVAGHAGATPRPLQKVASGGELARISLAISVITSNATATPTLIFDEVDSGIGGAVAEVVGRLQKRLGHDRQVLCVTHLAQVASQADQHFQVSKTAGHDKRTVSHIAPLDSKARVEEVARMLGGLEITATTRKHARELLAS